MAAAAAEGRFELQQCRQCATVQYPPREACHHCLSVELDWAVQPGAGRLLSETTLHHSHLPRFRARLPFRIGLVQLCNGPIALAFVHKSTPSAPVDVEVSPSVDEDGCAVLMVR